MTSSNEIAAANYDDAWKEALKRYFEALIAFFFAEAHSDIDWSRSYELFGKGVPVERL